MGHDPLGISGKCNGHFLSGYGRNLTLDAQLGTNFTTYLEKIVSMIEKIGQSLPAYEEYLKLFSARRKKLVIETSEYDEESSFQLEFCNHRLYKALSYVYVDIIQFCQEACNIFGTKRGGMYFILIFCLVLYVQVPATNPL